MKSLHIKSLVILFFILLPLRLQAATATLTPATYDYGSVTIGSSSTQVFTLTNTNGLTTLTITSATVAGTPFTKIADNCTGNTAMSTLNATCTITVQYIPTTTASSFGTLTVVTNATDGTNKITSFQGAGVTGPSVTGTLTPSSYSYGSVTIGSSSAATFTVENTGGSINLTITSATVAAPFTKTADNCTGTSLALNATCTIEVSYVPTAATTTNSVLTVVTNATNGTTKISTLSGTGITGTSVTASLSPGTYGFGNVTIGSSSTVDFTLENTGGNSNLTITSATASAAPFTKTADSCTGASLALNATCTITITYFPTAAAVSFGTLTVVTNATDGTTKIASLVGTGIAGPSVTSTLTPSTYNYGSVSVGSLSSTTFTIENTGGTANLNITSATVGALPFIKTADGCTGASLALNETCDIEVSFFPTAATSSASILTVVTNATNGTNKIVSLTGTGVSSGTVTGSITPATYAFSDTEIGDTSSHAFTVENTGGTGNLNITTVAVTASTPFVINSDTCAGASLALNATCTVNVVFAPTDVGNFAGTLTIATNASNGTNKIASFTGSTASAGTIAFSSDEYAFSNDVETAVIYVTRTGGSLGSASVTYTTSPGTASEAAGDYDETAGTLSWSNGDSSPKKIEIPVHERKLNDSLTFLVVLSENSGNALLGTNVATVELFDPTQKTSSSTGGGSTTDNSGCMIRPGEKQSDTLWVLLSCLAVMLTIKRRFCTKMES